MSYAVLRALRKYTGYDNISIVGDTYVIVMDSNARHKVKGLAQKGKCFGLATNDFDDIPLAFFVTMHDQNDLTSAHEYWTKAGRFYREDDQPSYVMMNHDGRFTREWRRGDDFHRETGPHSHTGKFNEEFAKTGPIGYQGLQRFHYEHCAERWYKAGDRLPYRDYRSGPHKIIMSKAIIYRDDDGVIQSPDEETPAISCNKLWIDWNRPTGGELFPKSITICDFKEHRVDGEVTERTGSDVVLEWGKSFEKYNGHNADIWFRDNMLDRVNLFDGPFYQDPTDEYIVLNELDRIEGK